MAAPPAALARLEHPRRERFGRLLVDDGAQQVVLLRGRTEIEAAAPAWRTFIGGRGGDSLYADPAWILDRGDDEVDEILVLLLLRSGRVAGVAPFREVGDPVPLRVGEIAPAAVPLVRLRPFGRAIRLPADEAAHDAVLTALSRSGVPFGAVFFDGIETGSFLSTYLRSSAHVAREFVLHRPESPSSRLHLEFAGTYREWLRSASSRIRRHDRMNRLRARGPVRVERVAEPSLVEEFVRKAAHISRRTYQYNLLGLGIRDEAGLSRRLRAVAARGNLRSYLLYSNDEPCSFYVGYQDETTHHFIDTGYDPAFRKASAGTVLFLRVIEDLFAETTPERLDLGNYADYKAGLANASVSEEKLWLFKRRDWPHLARLLLRGSEAVSRLTTGALDGLGVLTIVKNALRRRRSRHD